MNRDHAVEAGSVTPLGRAFLILLRSPRSRWDEIDLGRHDAQTRGHEELIDDLRRNGQLIHCSPLAPPEDGVDVRSDAGRLIVAAAGSCAGPNAEDTPLAGFYLVRCATTEDAVRIAARIPDAQQAVVHVRPLLDLTAVGLTADHDERNLR